MQLYAWVKLHSQVNFSLRIKIGYYKVKEVVPPPQKVNTILSQKSVGSKTIFGPKIGDENDFGNKIDFGP